MQDQNTVYLRSDDQVSSVQNVLAGQHDKALKYISEYAALSALIYGTECSPEITQCASSWTALDLPVLCPCEGDQKGLGRSAFYKVDDGRVFVALVFRGTTHRFEDWFANFDWLTRWIPFARSHYDHVISNIEPSVQAITQYLLTHQIAEDPAQICFSAMGHSLGGGLAQQAGYASQHIETVFAFSPSPVTGARRIEACRRCKNSEGLKIYIIWEQGEVLSKLRFLAGVLMQLYRVFSFKPNQNPRVVQVRFNFVQDQGALAQHSMQQLAHHMSTSRINTQNHKNT